MSFFIYSTSYSSSGSGEYQDSFEAEDQEEEKCNEDQEKETYLECDTNKLIGLMKDFAPELEKFTSIARTSRKETVLFIGNTDSGKSTSINYLAGCKMIMQRITNESGRVKRMVAIDPVTKIGQEAHSETLYPAAINLESLTNILADCPGFADDRGCAFEVCANIATKCITNTVPIKSVIVTIPRASITEEKGKLLKSVIKTLTNFIVDPEYSKDSIRFLVTKVMDNQFDIEDVMDELNRIINTSKNLNKQEKKILKLINPENTLIIKPLDDGSTRTQIMELIASSKGLRSEEFAFTASEQTLTHFKQMAFNVAGQGLDLFSAHKANLEMERVLAKELTELDQELDFLDTQKEDALKERESNTEEREEKKQIVLKQIGSLKDQVRASTEDLEKARVEARDFAARIKDMNPDEVIVDLSGSWTQSPKIFTWGSPRFFDRENFTRFDYSIKPSHKESEVRIEKDGPYRLPNGNVYDTKITARCAQRFKKHVITVNRYNPKRKTAEYGSVISNLETQERRRRYESSRLEEKLKELDKKISQHEQILEDIEYGATGKIIETTKAQLRDLNEQKSSNETKHILLKEKTADLQKKIDNKMDEFDMLYNISLNINMHKKELVVKEFVSAYENYVKEQNRAH